MSKIEDLKQKNEQELLSLLQEKKTALRKMRFKSAEGKLRRNHLVKETRRTVSRILTLLSKEKQKASQPEGEKA